LTAGTSGAHEWEPIDKENWSVFKSDEGHVYRLGSRSTYEPPVKSPKSRSVLKDIVLSDFVNGALIQVFFDDMAKPCMAVEDETFLSGGFGIGSFNNFGDWDDVKIWGKKVEN
jgi:hypothetical protein